MARARFLFTVSTESGNTQEAYVSANFDVLTLSHLFNLGSVAVAPYERDDRIHAIGIVGVFVTDHDGTDPPEHAWRRIPLEEPAFNFI